MNRGKDTSACGNTEEVPRKAVSCKRVCLEVSQGGECL